MLKARTDDRPEVATLGGYKMLRRLDAGGRAEVYLAERPDAGAQPVAVKVVRVDGGSPSTRLAGAREGAVARFLREAHVLARFTHPNILPVHEAGIENGHLYLAMRYVAGGSLADAIRGRSRHPMRLPAMLPLVIELVGQLASALQYSHDRGVVHGAVRPSNVLVEFGLEAYPHLLLADFGVAREFAPPLAHTRAAGTVAYMAPEQFGGRAVPASDQYALAVLAYQLLTKRTPSQGVAAAQTFGYLYGKPHGKPPAAHGLNRTLPPEVSEVLGRALAKDPRARFPSVSAFAEALRDATHALETALLVGDDRTEAQAQTPPVVLGTRPEEAPASAAPASRGGRMRAAWRADWRKLVALIAASTLLAFALVADVSMHPQDLSRGLRSSAATPPATATAGSAATATPTERPATGDAASIAQVIAPASVVPGQLITAHITFANTGTTTWTDGAGYRLVCDTEHHPRQNCPARLNVTLAGLTIAPGQTMRFTLMLVAPGEPGTSETWVNLSRDGALFLTPAAHLAVTVAPAPLAATPIQPPPAALPTATPRPNPTPTTAPTPTPVPQPTPSTPPAPTPTPSPPAPTPTPSPPAPTPTTEPTPPPEPTPSPPAIAM